MTTYWRTACGARTRHGTPCLLPKGWGTIHPGEGRCKLHGGCAGRHVKHGGYSTVAAQEYMPPKPVLSDPMADLHFRHASGILTLVNVRLAEMCMAGTLDMETLCGAAEAMARACNKQFGILRAAGTSPSVHGSVVGF